MKHEPKNVAVASGAGYIQCSCGWRSMVEDDARMGEPGAYNASKAFSGHCAESGLLGVTADADGFVSIDAIVAALEAEPGGKQAMADARIAFLRGGVEFLLAENRRLREAAERHWRTEPVAVTWVESDGKRHFREWNPRGCLLQSLMEEGIEWQTLYPRPANDA